MKQLICLLILYASMSPKLIFDFNKTANIKNWIVVDDVVMGGKSAGTFSLSEEGHGVFKGHVSLDNNGGFSSVRYDLQKTTIDDCKLVVIKLKGDGKDYQFRIKSDTGSYYSYIASFATSGNWEQISIPLEGMYPSFRGRKLNSPNFSSDRIEEITFLIGNKRNEDFKLLIDNITLQ